MEKAISDGLHQGWFELHFQPQYDLRTRRLTGFEALVRMNHPELGELLPDAFLPVAEESGLIQPLGEWIIREALTTAADWPHAPDARRINVSIAQFRHGDVAEHDHRRRSRASGFDGCAAAGRDLGGGAARRRPSPCSEQLQPPEEPRRHDRARRFRRRQLAPAARSRAPPATR